MRIWKTSNPLINKGGPIIAPLQSPSPLLKDFGAWVPNTTERLSEGQPPILLFDIETDGLLPDLTRLHSLVIKNAVTGEVTSAHHDTLQPALDLLAAASVIAGHNVIGFDLPAIQKVYPAWKPKGHVFDTLNASRLIWPELANDDFAALRKHTLPEAFPKKLIGSHSLKAWGFRLGILKDEFGEGTDWQSWSPQMQSYCEQDVAVTEALFRHILSLNYSQTALALEFAFQEVISRQEQTGFPFNLKKAEQLYASLAAQREEISQALQASFPPKQVEEVFMPKVNNKTRGYVKGQPFIKRHTETFNPNSTAHIAERLREKYGWVPESFTPTGEPMLDEEALSSLPYPEAKQLAQHREINKIIAMLAEGKNGWLKLVTPDHRIHGRVTTNGTVTGRCTHSKPNLGQVPRRGELGKLCRELFEAPPGYVLVGADASGLELRVFGHFLARYDNGKYAHEVVHGDIHTANQKAAGLPTRDDAKVFVYAYLYGAGPVLLGALLHPDGTETQKKKAGLMMKKRFLSRTPAIKRLMDDLGKTLATRRWLKGIDGRILPVRSKHSALNLVFQSAGALLIKLATVLWHWKLEERGYVHGKDYAQVAHVHDEVQAIARPDIADEVGKLFVEAIAEAGEFFKFRVIMSGEYKIGNNWKETH